MLRIRGLSGCLAASIVPPCQIALFAASLSGRTINLDQSWDSGYEIERCGFRLVFSSHCGFHFSDAFAVFHGSIFAMWTW